jgi:hypothetical protein
MIIDYRNSQSPELWVHENGYQTIHATNPRFHVVRNGEMRIVRKSDGAILRYTQDLYEAGLDTDEKIGVLFTEEGDYEVINNPWFEVIDVANHSDEGIVYDTLDDAIECADILYKSL